jgi:predicted  nucleic acid-binding Zn-ribbon protein
MSIVLYNMFLRFLLAAYLFLPGLSGLVTGGAYGESQAEYSKAMDEREALMGELARIEGQYQKFVGDIEKLKRNRADGLRDRRELEGLLRQSRQMADELEALQGRIRQVDGRLESQRRRILGAIDGRIAELERSIGSVPASERAQVVEQLNALKAERRRYAAPMPPLPDHRRVMEALEMASTLDEAHPAELLAAADELEDTEEQVRRRLAAIEERLAELQQARRLSRRASSFAREESFFEEGDRSRVIARYERVTRAGAEGPVVEGGASAPSSPTRGSDDGSFEAAPAPPGAEFDGAPAVGDSSAGGGDFDNAARGPEPIPHSPNFEDRRQTVVHGTDVDPSKAVGSVHFSDGNLDRNIRQLEEERRRLERQATELRRKADGLRKSARDGM